jgi:sRNA-binding protein
VLANHTERAGYLLALCYDSGIRVDLEGNPAGTVDVQAKAMAAQQLATPQQRQQTAAERYRHHQAEARRLQTEKAQRRKERQRQAEEKAQRREAQERRQQAKHEREAAATASAKPAASKIHIRYSLGDNQHPNRKKKAPHPLTEEPNKVTAVKVSTGTAAFSAVFGGNRFLSERQRHL